MGQLINPLVVIVRKTNLAVAMVSTLSHLFDTLYLALSWFIVNLYNMIDW